MATTEQAALLTEQARQAQNQLKAHALTDFLLLWPIWTGDTASFGSLVQATLPLVNSYHRMSSAISSAYYEAFRKAEGIKGAAAVRVAPALAPTQVTASLYATGLGSARKARDAGQQPEQARKTALVQTSGAVTRHILNGGRTTILDSVQADPQARGWARVTDSNPCAFCLTLTSRGAVYKTEQTADFQAHDHCGCFCEPVYPGSSLPPLTKQWKQIYSRAQREAVASGDLRPGPNTAAARINAVRRYLAAQSRT